MSVDTPTAEDRLIRTLEAVARAVPDEAALPQITSLLAAPARRVRRTVVAALAAAFVVAVAAVALFVADGAGSHHPPSQQPAPDRPARTHDEQSSPGPPPYTPQECVKQMVTAGVLTEAGTYKIYDLDLGAPIEMDPLDYCTQLVALRPDPAGDLKATYSVRGGVVGADYVRILNKKDIKPVVQPDGSIVLSPEPIEVPLSNAEAQAMLEQQRAGKTR